MSVENYEKGRGKKDRRQNCELSLFVQTLIVLCSEQHDTRQVAGLRPTTQSLLFTYAQVHNPCNIQMSHGTLQLDAEADLLRNQMKRKGHLQLRRKIMKRKQKRRKKMKNQQKKRIPKLAVRWMLRRRRQNEDNHCSYGTNVYLMVSFSL